jgi:hypothetical protein
MRWVTQTAAIAIAIGGFAVVGCGGQTAHPGATRAEPPVKAAEWKRVIRDWITHGHIAGQRSCAAVREALKHLPTSPPLYSTVYPDLRAYAKTVC